MACKNICRLCNRLILSTGIDYGVSTAGALTIGIPAGSYVNGEKYCIVVAQSIPATTTLDAPVQIKIGTTSTYYPLQRNDGAPVTARAIRTRTKYSTIVVTNATTGAFRLMGKICPCIQADALPAISG